MVNPFICGSGSFNHHLEEDDDSSSQSSTPRKSRKSSFSRSSCEKRTKDSKNPYANLGLEKFSALLAEVEDKKQKIYTQVPSDDISLVLFTYQENSDSMKPIVVRARDRKQENDDKNREKGDNKIVVDSKEALKKYPIEVSTNTNKAKQGIKKLGDNKNNNTKMKSVSWKDIKIELWKPYCYLTAILILILVFLALFGKSFTILCTSIGWYLVPTIKKGRSSSRTTKKKRDMYVRRASDKKLVVSDWLSSPKTVLTGAPVDDVAPVRKSHHRKSW